MNKTIKVDLSLFFDDERKMSCIFVDPNWKTVECMQRRVELLFDISSVYFLSDGCYLPPKEPIEIIKGCEVIKAFVLKESQEVRRKKKSKRNKERLENSESEEASAENNTKLTNGNEVVTSTRALSATPPISLQTNELLEEFNIEQEMPSSKKKRKPDNSNGVAEYDNVQQLFNAKHCTKLSKKRKSDNVQQLFNSKKFINPFKKLKSVCQLEDDDKLTTTRPSKYTSSKLQNERKILEECNHVQQIRGQKHTNSSFEKQKSGKTALNVVRCVCSGSVLVDDDMMSSACLSKGASSTLLDESNSLEESENTQKSYNSSHSSIPRKKSKTSKAHIYFNDSDDGDTDILSHKSKKAKNVSAGIKKKPGTIVFRCPLKDIANSDDAEALKPRIFHLKSKNTAAKQIIEIQEDILISSTSSQNVTNKTTSCNEATMVNNSEKEATEAEPLHNQQSSLNSTAEQNENEEQVNSNKSNNEHQNEESSLNSTTEQNENEQVGFNKSNNEHQNEESSLNSTTEQTQNKEVSSNKSNNEQTRENATINKSIATEAATEIEESHKTDEFLCLNESASESQNETEAQNDLSALESVRIELDIPNNSQKDDAYDDKNFSEVTETSKVNEEICLNENSVMSVGSVDLTIEEDTTVTEPPQNSKMITSLNSTTVDLSNDLDDEVLLADDSKEHHNVSADDGHNNSSLSDVEEVSEIIDLNESDNCSSSTLNNSKQVRSTPRKKSDLNESDNCNSTTSKNSKQQNNSSGKIQQHHLLPLSSIMADLPDINDTIMFKVSYTKHKQYACTDFIAGKVEYINKRTKNIKVLILDGVSELTNVPTKFFCNLDDSVEGENKRLQLKLSDMIEPKLVAMP